MKAEAELFCRGPADQGVREVPGREFTVVNIPNQGREGETYMHHILLRWDTLVSLPSCLLIALFDDCVGSAAG